MMKNRSLPVTIQFSAGDASLSLMPIGRIETGFLDASAAEIVASDATVPAGVQPLPMTAVANSVAVRPDGHTLLVANEAEPCDDYAADSEGSISIIDVPSDRLSAAPVRCEHRGVARVRSQRNSPAPAGGSADLRRA